jgi:hypothetical protein
MFIEHEWKENSNLLIAMLKQRLGKTQFSIGARKCSVIQITDKRIEKEFFEKNHIAGSVGSTYCIGLKENKTGKILSMMSFRRPIQHKDKIEIARFANDRT